MEQDWLLYSITSFTFAAIFLMCYIQHVFTHFQAKNIYLVSQPTFPFGNVYDVSFLHTPLFLKLWKYSKKLERKSQPFGGFFIFLKPAVLVVDPALRRTILADFQNVDPPSVKVSTELWDAVAEKYLSDFQPSWQAINQNFDDNQIDLSSALDEFAIDCCTRKVFCATMTPNCSQKLRDSLKEAPTFCDLILLSYPNKFFSGFFRNRKNIIPNHVFADGGDSIFDSQGISKSQLFTQVLATLRSINNLILFALYEIAQSPKIQKRLREEIDAAKDEQYLEAVICETLRKYPPHPFIAKICQNDYKFNDRVTFPKNTLMFVSTFGMHHDEQNFLNPERFQPERFINSANLITDDTRYIPIDKTDSRLIYKNIVRGALKEIVSNTRLTLGEKTATILELSGGIFGLSSKENLWLKINKI